jgi:hypothetical protein
LKRAGDGDGVLGGVHAGRLSEQAGHKPGDTLLTRRC